MKKNVTRMIALALIALMCFTLLPMAAFASEPETGAPQVELVRHIIDGQPGEIRGLTADMEYTNAETGWAWADAPASGVLQVARSCTTYFCYRGFENDETRKSSVAIYDYFTVTPSAGEGGSVSPSDVQVLLKGNSGPDGSATFSFTPNEGYELEDVKVDGVSVGAQSSYTVSNVTAAKTISASFKQAPPPAPTTYTVTATAGTGGSISPSGAQTVNAGGSISFSVSPTSGYEVEDVKVNGESIGAVSSCTIANVTANTTVAASFREAAADTISVTVTHNGYGSVKYGNNTVVSGTPVTVPRGTSFTLQPNTGARTKTVRKDNVQVAAASSYSFQANGTLEVTFEQGLPASSFGTSVSGPTASVISGSIQKYTYNISLTLNGSAAANAYPTGAVSFLLPYPSGMSATSHTYTLKHLPDNQSVSVTADADGIHGSSANFSTFELTATPRAANDNLSVVINPTSAHPGTVMSATVTPSTASVTYQWKVNGVAIANETKSTYTIRDTDVGNIISCTVTDTTNSANMKPSNGVTPTATGSSSASTAAPTTPAVERHILDGQPGIIKGLDTTMEYLAPRASTWAACTGATLTVADGKEGTYYFRYKQVGTTPASNSKAVTIRSYYTVHAWVNRGYGTISPDTTYYTAEVSKGSTDAVSYVEKGGSYKLSIYPARRYYIYTVLDGGEYKGRGSVYNIKSVTSPHLIIVNFAENYSPRTADDSNIPLWTTLCCASLAGVGAVWMILRKRKEE